MKGAGNVYLHGAKPSVHDRDALVNADFKPDIKQDIKQEEKADGWWLKMTVDPAWVSKQKRTIVTSEALGKAKIPDAPFENPDGSPFKIDADYFGKPRNPENPAPGPFSFSGDRDISVKVWPLVSPLSACAQEKKRPNVLMIAVDDLNDWIGCLGGHQQAKTPHIDRLASRGVVFSNAHCQSPVCNPSRVSMMTSLYPATTGIYFIAPGLESSEVALKITTMPQRFEKDGYYVTGAGKLFHGSQNGKYHPNYKGSFGSYGPSPKKKLNPNPSPSRLWDWGVYPESNNDEEMPDHKIAAWGVAQLEKSHDKPLYLGGWLLSTACANVCATEMVRYVSTGKHRTAKGDC